MCFWGTTQGHEMNAVRPAFREGVDVVTVKCGPGYLPQAHLFYSFTTGMCKGKIKLLTIPRVFIYLFHKVFFFPKYNFFFHAGHGAQCTLELNDHMIKT